MSGQNEIVPNIASKETKENRRSTADSNGSGQSMKFLEGKYGPDHNCWKGGRTISDGYIFIYVDSYKQTGRVKYKGEHIIIAESALGHSLPAGAAVHHVNECRSDNRNSNLVICENNAYHKLLHRRMIAYRETGIATARKCVYCKQWDMFPGPTSAWPEKGGAYHRPCHADYERQRKNKIHKPA